MADTTTSAVERLADALDGHHRVESPMFTGDAHDAAATLRALAVERDALLDEVIALRGQVAEARAGEDELAAKGERVAAHHQHGFFCGKTVDEWDAAIASHAARKEKRG